MQNIRAACHTLHSVFYLLQCQTGPTDFLCRQTAGKIWHFIHSRRSEDFLWPTTHWLDSNGLVLAASDADPSQPNVDLRVRLREGHDLWEFGSQFGQRRGWGWSRLLLDVRELVRKQRRFDECIRHSGGEKVGRQSNERQKSKSRFSVRNELCI